MRIVFDYPGRQMRTEVGRWLARAVGSLLILVGLLATVVAIPAGFVTLGDIVNTLQPQPEVLFEPAFPLREVEAAFAASVVIAVAGLRYGRRLVRGRRRVVLFLRRFGYDGSMQVVTYAVATTIGTSWRLVTLDDHEIAPLGVDTAPRLFFGAGERLVWLAKRAYQGVMIVFPWAIYGMCGVIALQVLSVWPNWERLLRDGTLDRYAAIFSSVMERRVPVEYFEPSLTGAFAVFATVLGIGFAGLLISFVVLLAMIPLFGFVILASSSAEALRKAERDKTATISRPSELAPFAQLLAQRGRETFAPRLVVVRVAGAIWQQTVSSLATVAAATIVDISEPTTNLVWELRELDRQDHETRCIYIGNHERLDPWSEDPLHAQVSAAIGDRDVLAYTTDRAGMRRFARALQGMLLDVPPATADG